ncbi:hypothetical protein NL676_018521 [Syzygium grande]|nr:hypothetical protein NL676_018521 [Syzygium grande]
MNHAVGPSDGDGVTVASFSWTKSQGIGTKTCKRATARSWYRDQARRGAAGRLGATRMTRSHPEITAQPRQEDSMPSRWKKGSLDGASLDPQRWMAVWMGRLG